MTTRRRLKPRYLTLFLVVVLVALVGGITAWSTLPGRATSAPEQSVDGLNSVTWPKYGEAAVGLESGPIAASSAHPVPMASISKLLTSLMILEARPLAVGEQGDEYSFTYEDDFEYLEYVRRGQSALQVPIDGVLTQYQLLEGMLIGSACNYADVLAQSIWGGNDAFIAAAASFISRNGLDGITMVEPTGFDARNTATPASLILLGRLALANPVIAKIVSKTSIQLPGAGLVENTNDLLADPGVVGIKTGTLDGYNLLSAKETVSADGDTERVYVVVLTTPDDASRFRESRSLYEEVAKIGG